MIRGVAGLAAAATLSASDPIAAIELLRLEVPLRRAHRAAHGTEQVRPLVLVRVVGADGAEGWGECPALTAAGYVAETSADALEALRGRLAPAACRGQGPAPGDPSMAAAAMRDALLDRALRRKGQSLASALGVAGARVPTAAVLPLVEAVGELQELADQRVAEGSALIKAKVRPGSAAATARALRRHLPAGVDLAVDANGSLAPGDAELAELGELGLAYLEQPVAGAATAGLRTPVALDEALADGADLLAWVRSGPGRLANLKPARLGGVAAAAVLVEELGAEAGRAFVGGMLESGLGRAGALAVAARLAMGPGAARPTDLGPSSAYFDEDLTEPIERAADGRLPVPDEPGLGRTPRPELLGGRVVVRTLVEAS